MKVVINTTTAAIYACGKLLIPGTNVLDDKEFDADKADAKSFIESGALTVKDPEKMTEADKKKAVENVTTREAVKGLKKAVKGIDTKPAEEKLDKFDEQLKKGS